MVLTTEKPPGKKGDKLMVLLVEDSDDDAYFFQRILRKSGEQCDYAHLQNGRKAVELLETMAAQEIPGQDPTLMFLDLKMPVLSGFDVLTWIKQARLQQSLHVVVLSGSDDPQDRQRARELGAAEYIVKPISIERLKDEIRTARGAHKDRDSHRT
jgi:CheY-like chemotaxis protein